MNVIRLVEILDGLINAGYGDHPVLAWDGDSSNMEEVSGVVYGGDDNVVELYTDDD